MYKEIMCITIDRSSEYGTHKTVAEHEDGAENFDFDGNIYINGEILNESYGAEVIENPGLAAQEITLGEDK